MEKVKKKNNKNIFMLIALMFIMLLSSFSTFSFSTFAVESDIVYSNVLEDLEKDENFNKDDYPVNAEDYSLNVIQIAESSDDELFIYVYQPSVSEDIIATSINISTEYHNQAKYTNYKLKLLNSNGVFYKYLVEDFSVLNSATRCYEISSIFRHWRANIDLRPDGDNNTSYVSYPVAKIYIFKGVEDEFALLVYDTDYIQIMDKYVGFVRYLSGTNFFGRDDYCDSHFIAFSTDKKIDNLLEADVYFKTQRVGNWRTYLVGGNIELSNEWTFGNVEENYSYMDEESTFVYESSYDCWYNASLTRQRIQSVSQFLAGEDFSNSYKCGIFNTKASYKMDSNARSIIEEKNWILRFYESSYVEGGRPGQTYNVRYTNVSDVSILRLKFETDGKVYDLGVVDNMQSGSDTPANIEEKSFGINWWIVGPIIAAAILILIIIFCPGVIVGFFKLIFVAFKYIFKGLWYVITLPAALFKKGD